MKYAGMATQFIATLGVAIFIGFKADKYIAWKFPLLTILLPLLMLVSMFYKIFKDSEKK